MVINTTDDLPPEVWKVQAEQVPQYSEQNGVRYMADEVCERLLYYDGRGALRGIFKYFPKDVPETDTRFGNKMKAHSGDFVILVHPDHRRRGVGMKLLQAANERWQLNLDMQEYSPSSAALVNKFLSLTNRVDESD